MQNYGFVGPGNSSVMLIFLALLFSAFIFDLMGYTRHLLVILFAGKKSMARATNCLASPVPLILALYFAAPRRRQVADHRVSRLPAR